VEGTLLIGIFHVGFGLKFWAFSPNPQGKKIMFFMEYHGGAHDNRQRANAPCAMLLGSEAPPSGACFA